LNDAFSTVEWLEADWLDQTQNPDPFVNLSEADKAQMIDMLLGTYCV
jgi:hypothetical protein